MKKLLVAVAATAVLTGTAGAALADRVTVPGVGYVSNSEPGYALVAEGDNGNGLGPLSGFISVSSGGRVCADDNGSPDDGDASNGPESSSPTCTP